MDLRMAPHPALTLKLKKACLDDLQHIKLTTSIELNLTVAYLYEW